MGILANAKSIVSNGPTAATVTKMNAAAGPILDVPSNANLLVTKLQEANVLATQIKSASDSGDPNVTLLNTILGQLV